MFCDNSLGTDLAFGDFKTEKTVNTQSGKLRKQQTYQFPRKLPHLRATFDETREECCKKQMQH